jgi:ABC-2 type transport system permease protein
MGLVLAGFIVYGIVANLVAWPEMGRIFFPNTMWLLLALWVAPAAAGLGLSPMVFISIYAQSVQEANQWGSVMVVPMVLLMIAQALGVLYFNLWLTLLLGLLLWSIDGVLLWLGGRVFRRSWMVSRL